MSLGYLPEIELHIETTEIRATTRKLKVTWSLEAEQDLLYWHSPPYDLGLDLGVEFTDTVIDYDWLEEGF